MESLSLIVVTIELLQVTDQMRSSSSLQGAIMSSRSRKEKWNSGLSKVAEILAAEDFTIELVHVAGNLSSSRSHEGKGLLSAVFHLAVLCDSLRCGAYGTFCYGIS